MRLIMWLKWTGSQDKLISVYRLVEMDGCVAKWIVDQ